MPPPPTGPWRLTQSENPASVGCLLDLDLVMMMVLMPLDADVFLRLHGQAWGLGLRGLGSPRRLR